MNVCVFCGGDHTACDDNFRTSHMGYVAKNAIHDVSEYIDTKGSLEPVTFFVTASAEKGLAQKISVSTFDKQGKQVGAMYMALLIPDRNKENREDFVWCLPVDRVKWQKWYDLAHKFRTKTPKAHGQVWYMNRMDGRETKTIIMLPTSEHDDDTVTAACAYLRLVKQITCRMYVIRCTDDPIKGPQLMAHVAGADPDTLVEIDDESGETES